MISIIILLCCWIDITEAEVKIDVPVTIGNEFNQRNLMAYIKLKNIKHPEIVYAQAVLETGNFTSKIFLHNNNLFGMKYVRTDRFRKTTAIKSHKNHALYNNWKSSVDDYLLWQQMFKLTPTETKEDYFTLLSKKYSTSKKYIQTLKLILEKKPSNDRCKKYSRAGKRNH